MHDSRRIEKRAAIGPSSARRVRPAHRAPWILSALLVLALGACASQRPVLYPNEQLEWAGPELAKRDVDDCMQLAKESGAADRSGEEAVGETVVGAGSGAASGAAHGAIWGAGAGRGAAAGAAGAGAAGLLRGIFRRRPPDPGYRAFVDRCLRERGYEPVSWQ